MQKNLIAALAASALVVAGVGTAGAVTLNGQTQKTEAVAVYPYAAPAADQFTDEPVDESWIDAAAAKARADEEAARVAAEQEAARVAAEAQAQAIAQQQAASRARAAARGQVAGSSGSRVPFVPSSDPNNANGGDYQDPATFCQSGSASGNPPVCD